MAEPTVLILDDDPTMLLVLQAVLERRNVKVLDSADEKSAIGHCEELPGAIDLLVADVILRHSDGPAVVRRVKYLQPQMRLLFISGFGLDDLGRKNLLHAHDLAPRAAEFLQKPFSAEAFLSCVDGLLSA